MATLQDFVFPKDYGLSKEAIKDIFEKFPLCQSHATRDHLEVGNSEKLEKIVFIKKY